MHMKVLIKESKKGITLVESMIAVALLAIAVTGILSMMVVSGTKIFNIRGEASDYAEATVRMDRVIAAISNGYTTNAEVGELFNSTTGALSVSKLNEFLQYNESGYSLQAVAENIYDKDNPAMVVSIRGWYLTLTYETATVTGYASNTKGVFDNG